MRREVMMLFVAGRVIADSRRALTLREAAYSPVHYIPRRNVDMSLLARTDHVTYCPFKGDCAYYSIPIGGERSANAVWTYGSRSHARNFGSSHKPACVTNFGFRYASIASLPPSDP